jgi:molybdate transport system substrate-binding protein
MDQGAITARSALIALVALTFAGPAVAAPAKLSVAAAANLAPLGDELARSFEAANAGVEVEFAFASTGTLSAQVRKGAPYDIFLSADEEAPALLFKEGLCEGEPRTYALGTLILFSRQKRDLSAGLGALKAGGMLAMANPATAPYGRAAQAALAAAGIDVGGRLVLGQSAAQAAQFALTSADFGLIPKSSLFTEAFAPFAVQGEHWIEVDPRIHAPIRQSLCILASGEKKALAAKFADFLISGEGRRILLSKGYRGT